MSTANGQPLPRVLRARAERCFQTDFTDVRWHIGPQPSALDAIAFAFGPDIFLCPGFDDFSRPRNLRILGHELAHVVQQRQGRVWPDRRIGGVPVSGDPQLELEAEEMADRFVSGSSSRPSRPVPEVGSQRAAMPVAQRLVTVGGASLIAVEQLSVRAQNVLSMIGFGAEWLAWAASEPVSVFPFADEVGLLTGIQTGLHGMPALLIRDLGLRVSPERLYHLGDEPLNMLASVRTSESSRNTVASVGLTRLLADHRLRTQQELTCVGEFLTSLDLDQRSLFRARSLADEIALFELLIECNDRLCLDPAVQKKAGEFALSFAASPQEFADYYRFYMLVASKLGESSKPKKRRREAEAILEELLPFLDGCMECPSWGQAPTFEELTAVLQSSIAGGQPVGFSHHALGARLMLQHSSIGSPEERGALLQNARNYWQEAQGFLAEHVPSAVEVAQDGRSRTYFLSDRSRKAELYLDDRGRLTLQGFYRSSGPGAAGDGDTVSTGGQSSGPEASEPPPMT